MTIIYTEDKKFVPFHEFLNLTESITPKKTDYGTDFKNEKWDNRDNTFITFFNHNSNFHVLVVLNKAGILSFASHHGEPSTDLDDYNLERSNFDDALKIFNKVIYVALEGARDLHIEEIKFNGQDERLDKTYKIIANNKIFQDKLKEFGFYYNGQDVNKLHIFSKFSK
jgi:hypothetical protein